ncbi:MAG TPA: FAD-dependent oxidoreductase [Candidatus Obscuribacterales bacterium]
MVSWTEPARELPVLAETDVLVVGGGSAGSAAAIAAARQGARTLLIEQQGFLGGTSTGALVTPMMANHLQQQPLNQGIYLEVLSRLLATADADIYKDGNAGWFNPEMLKLVLEDLAVAAGVELFYHLWFADALVQDQTLNGIVVETKSGRGVIRAHCTVDCSGDADVAFRAGAPMVVGRADTGANQPMALRFLLGNVHLGRAQAFFTSLGDFDVTESTRNPDIPLWTTACTWDKDWPLKPLFEKAVADGVLTPDDAIYFQIFTVPGRPGEVAFNCPRFDELTNSLDFRQRNTVQIEGKRSILRLWKFCRDYLPGFEKSYIVEIAPMIGVRESRRIVGEYVLTSEDFFAARKFPDAIARNNYPIDIHSRDASGGLHFMKAGDYHEIPYRCLVPLEIEQLLVAGRCLSADFSAQGAVRIIPNCYAMGQAAGVAAALAVQQRKPPRGLDTGLLLETLRRQDALVEIRP